MSEAVAGALTTLSSPAHQVPVAIYSRNDYRVLACTLGIMRAGHIIVAVHAQNTVAPIKALMLRSKRLRQLTVVR